MADLNNLATGPGLTRGVAAMIVDAVVKDKESQRVMPPAGSILPKSWGVSGSIRNILIMGPNLYNPFYTGPTTAEESYVCTGISDITVIAIKAARISDVKRVGTVSRGSATGVTTEHTATLVELTSGRSFVFDWHATLDRDNPLIYASIPEFEKAKTAVPFKEFTGFL